jgi:hypothetical protein
LNIHERVKALHVAAVEVKALQSGSWIKIGIVVAQPPESAAGVCSVVIVALPPANDNSTAPNHELLLH